MVFTASRGSRRDADASVLFKVVLVFGVFGVSFGRFGGKGAGSSGGNGDCDDMRHATL